MVYSDIIKNDLSADNIKEIIGDINNGRKRYSKNASDEELKYHNGRYTTIWDYIFTDIENSFKSKAGFKCFSIKRCALWKFAAIYKEDNDVLYLVAKEKRFKELQKDHNPYHYFKIFNSKNCSLYKSRAKQISYIPDMETSIVDADYIDADLEEMIGEIKDKVKNCVNILFRENSDGVYRISANIATQDLEIVATEDWSEYITANVEEINDTNSSIENEETKSPEIPLPIKQGKIKDKKEKLINTKQDNENINKTKDE